jgi:hypothetical protein
MSDKKYSGNFYKTDKIEETPDDCPNCRTRKQRRTRMNAPTVITFPTRRRRKGRSNRTQ